MQSGSSVAQAEEPELVNLVNLEITKKVERFKEAPYRWRIEGKVLVK